MMTWIHFKNDITQIVREPVMLMLLLAPLLMLAAFKIMIVFLLPVLESLAGFDSLPYYPYVLSFIMLMIPGMLGIVTGFMMLDEKDGHIAELMSVTPLGRVGYLVNRLSFSSFLSIPYCFAAYYLLRIHDIPFLSLVYIVLLLAMCSAITGLLLFSGADDKVKGLTFAKGLNILNLFAFADLFSMPWLIVLSWFFPAYWVTAILKNPGSPVANIAAFAVHLAWLSILILRYRRRSQ
jgi:fluoroquinolone transport system permease protein